MRAIRTRLALGIATLALALASGAANADCDFLTGGGFIIPNGANANFGVAGGCSKDGTPTWGHLEYIDHGYVVDHGAGLNVHGTSITAYFAEGLDGTDLKGRLTGTRIICGKARTNQPAPNDVDVDSTDHSVHTMWYYAAEQNNKAIMTLLLSRAESQICYRPPYCDG